MIALWASGVPHTPPGAWRVDGVLAVTLTPSDNLSIEMHSKAVEMWPPLRDTRT
jgi:hypothetical protein